MADPPKTILWSKIVFGEISPFFAKRKMAERARFELARRLPTYVLSKHAH